MCSKRKRTIGMCIVGLGVLVIMALILPTNFWWFVLGVGLIALGIFVCKK